MTNGILFQTPYTEVFTVPPTSTVPHGSGYVEFATANSQNWQSMEVTAPTTNTTRQSRSRHRHLADSRLNNSFVDSAVVSSAADTRINDIRRVEENLQMESRMLSENNNIPMARCSTPSPAYCFHCDHDHRERCCLYVGDKPEDGPCYSRWKRDLENPTVRPQYIPKIPEAVSGNSSPFWFPAYTCTKPEEIKQKMMEKHPPLPPVYMRQYYYPIVGYGHEYQLLNQATMEPPTPYQQYLQQHQQHLFRMYHHQQQQQQQQQQHQQQQYQQHHREDSACREGRKCEGVGATAGAPPSTPLVQQYHAHHVHNLQAAGDYMQQMHQAPYYYHNGGYYGGHQPPQHHYVPAGYPANTGGIPIYHDAYLHSAHYPVSYAPVPALPPRTPTPPATPPSTPLWLLFCQKLSRKFPDRSKKSSPTKGRSPGKNFPHHHVRHNPTTLMQPSVLPSAVPDYHPPKYTTIDHPQLQYQPLPAPCQSYPAVAMNAGQHSRIGQTMATQHPHTPYYSHVPMNDIGMYYVASTAVNI